MLAWTKPWPENVYCEVFRTQSFDVPDDAEESIDYCLSGLPAMHTYCFKPVYEERIPVTKLCKDLKVSKSSLYASLKKCRDALCTDRNKRLLRKGVSMFKIELQEHIDKLNAQMNEGWSLPLETLNISDEAVEKLRAYGIKSVNQFSTYLNSCEKQWTAPIRRAAEELGLDLVRRYRWPLNLYTDLFGRNVKIPKDAEETIETVLFAENPPTELIVKMLYVQGKSIHEVAEELGQPAAEVTKYTCMILNKLKSPKLRSLIQEGLCERKVRMAEIRSAVLNNTRFVNFSEIGLDVYDIAHLECRGYFNVNEVVQDTLKNVVASDVPSSLLACLREYALFPKSTVDPKTLPTIRETYADGLINRSLKSLLESAGIQKWKDLEEINSSVLEECREMSYSDIRILRALMKEHGVKFKNE